VFIVLWVRICGELPCFCQEKGRTKKDAQNRKGQELKGKGLCGLASGVVCVRICGELPCFCQGKGRTKKDAKKEGRDKN
jgi:hypothetical protein